jgi:hypothetical protein
MHFLFSISASLLWIWIQRKSTKAANERNKTEKNAGAAEHHTMCTIDILTKLEVVGVNIIK